MRPNAITIILTSFSTTTRRHGGPTEAICWRSRKNLRQLVAPAPPPSASTPPSSKGRSFWTVSWRAVSFRLRRLTSGHIHEEPRSAWASGVGRIINESSARQILHQDFTRSLAVEAENGRRDDYMARCEKLTLFKKKRHDAALAHVHAAVLYQWGKSGTRASH